MTKKEALLKAAKELFGEYGYAETTFKKISERAGVALGLLTHHYGNKEKLFLAAGMDVLNEFLGVLREACAKGKTGRSACAAFRAAHHVHCRWSQPYPRADALRAAPAL